MRISRDEMFTEILKTVEKRSSCKRKQVAALIVKDGRIISTGYNGPPSGMNCTDCIGPHCNRSVHAEINAIVFAAKYGVSIDGATMYCSYSPCVNCTKAIINSGIKELIYVNTYEDTTGLGLLRKTGIVDIKY